MHMMHGVSFTFRIVSRAFSGSYYFLLEFPEIGFIATRGGDALPDSPPANAKQALTVFLT